MSVGPFGTPSGPSAPGLQSLGPAPTSRAPPSTLGGWNPPASQSYRRPPAVEPPAYAPGIAAPVAHVPSLARRLTFGALRLVPLLIVYVVLPNVSLQALQSQGLVSGLPLAQVTVFGAGLAVLSTAAYVVRPTRAYGPLSVVSSLGKVLYLVYFATFAWVALSLSTVGIQLDFGNLLLLLAVLPVFGIVSGVLITIEDARHPGERLPFDYPVR
jgi:hypothetical protein